MNQKHPGRTTASAGKVEPKAHAVSVDKVSNIGLQQIRTTPQSKDLVKGRGYEAPAPVSTKSHKGGSQGRH
jgi:hypothetical protein